MFELHHGDCLATLKTFADNSVDSIVTDPPYGLSFMGKRWDYDVPSTEVWAECLRVLKPGGHLLAFAGTRTQHRMAVRIEDAGFEIRDMIAWVYGSGFPKSLDVSKAIDKLDASEAQERRRLEFTAWVRSQGVTSRQIDEATGTNMGGHYTTAASQPAIMTREHLEACRHLFREVPEWVEREADQRTVESENFKKRGFYETPTGGLHGGSGNTVGSFTGKQALPYGVTEDAKKWQGWGTALKPALEPITVARKPLVGTVAENVLAHGTGALNIDGCRVATDEALGGGRLTGATKVGDGWDRPWMHDQERRNADAQAMAEKVAKAEALGRWPANLIHDGGEFLGEQARFFYCAKASKRDRDEGLEGFVPAKTNDGRKVDADNAYQRGATLRANTHPTVKPTDLMAYLCRLVTPPGGVVLDPFMGSGSTGKAAMREGFRFIGCELSPEYMEIARARIAHALWGDLA